MLFVDGLFALLLVNFLGVDALMTLGVLCMVTFLRIVPKLTKVLDVLTHAMIEVEFENNKEEK
jgi:hypothetical protein